MYKVSIEFHSNIKGVYTREEETATDYQQAKFKLGRMINRWFNILCPHIDLDKLNIRDENNLNIVGGMNMDDKETLEKLFINRTLEINDKIDSIFNNYSNKENIQERKFCVWLEKLEVKN